MGASMKGQVLVKVGSGRLVLAWDNVLRDGVLDALVKRNCLRSIAFRPHLSTGLALSKSANGYLRLPSGHSLREAWVRHLEVGPLHNFLKKGVK